jgi:hypothetical protein
MRFERLIYTTTDDCGRNLSFLGEQRDIEGTENTLKIFYDFNEIVLYGGKFIG